jgi:glucokinase
MDHMSFRLGIDLGGTSAKIALVSGLDKIVRQTSVPTEGFPSPALLAASIANACRTLADKKKVTRIGIGVAGDIDSKRGVVRVSPNLGWKNVPLGKLIQNKLKSPVRVENDANAAAWGYYKTQVPSSVQNLIVMTLGTGVGGGIIIDGRLLSGITGSAGEVGHMNIDQNGPLCNCGLHGCLETYVGGPHLIKKVQQALFKILRNV